MRYLTIILFCIMVAISYGIVHDEITAHLCVEYFTVGHPPVFGTDNPTLLGLGWGVLATWWVGLLLGVSLAFAAQYGDRPKRSVKSLLHPIGILLGVMAYCASLMGVIGHFVAVAHLVFSFEPLASKIPVRRQVPFLTDLWIHMGSYGAGLLGGLVLCGHVWRSRKRMASEIKKDKGRP